MLSNASSPAGLSEAAKGTPMTGRVVRAAKAPARCAAMPAAAIMTFIPLSAAVPANSAARSGVRCAESMRTTGSISKFFNCSIQLCITGKSLSEPMITATGDSLFLDVIVFSHKNTTIQVGV